MNTEFLDGMKRSHMCEELSLQDETKEVILCGWVAKRRDHGGLIFIDLRDRSGIVQVVFSPEINDVSFKKAEDVRSEYVLAVRGKVAKRSLETNLYWVLVAPNTDLIYDFTSDEISTTPVSGL